MEDDAREAAIKRLKAKRDFWTHVVTYLIVNAVLVGIWALSGAGYFWPIWAIGGWGVGLAFHAWSTFGEKPITEERIQREMRKQQGAD
ncbi:MAG: hypothetical protein JJLCMIEE_01752 [Acidimicrobiales bacterium]|nr:MAG: hypothetical protein EDR02_05600 [Actinomycetota bacterium]MBV6508686.1 hypothetical protein [Acidimicrobiales bacterium]RIK08124.1 MAG: hypothetical protein DCC48_01720 [Acidobacteriota bacterium]